MLETPTTTGDLWGSEKAPSPSAIKLLLNSRLWVLAVLHRGSTRAGFQVAQSCLTGTEFRISRIRQKLTTLCRRLFLKEATMSDCLWCKEEQRTERRLLPGQPRELPNL